MGGIGSGRFPKMDPAEKRARAAVSRKRYNRSDVGRLRRKLQRGGIVGVELDQAMHDLAPKTEQEAQLLRLYRRDALQTSC